MRPAGGQALISDRTALRLADTITFESMGEGEGAVILRLPDGQLYTGNDTTEAFLRALRGGASFGDAVDALAAEFEVERDMLRADLAELAEGLIAEGVVVADGG